MTTDPITAPTITSADDWDAFWEALAREQEAEDLLAVLTVEEWLAAPDDVPIAAIVADGEMT